MPMCVLPAVDYDSSVVQIVVGSNLLSEQQQRVAELGNAMVRPRGVVELFHVFRLALL